MRDGSLQQLIIVGMFLLLALIDLIGRVTRKRPDAPPADPDVIDGPDEQLDIERFEVATPRSTDRDVDEWRAESPGERPMPDERLLPGERPLPVESPIHVPRSAPTRVAPTRVAAPRMAPVRVAPVRAPSARKASAGLTALDRLDTGRIGPVAPGAPLLTVDDARRAILAMTILGPCRAFEPHQDPSGSR